MTSDERSKLRSAALGVLRQGRCRIARAVDNEQHQARRVMALVHSSRPGRGPYAVDGYDLDAKPRFSCTCRAGMAGQPCPHVAAVMLVTLGAIVRSAA